MDLGIKLLFSFFAGTFAFLSPCIIPMITIYLSLISGRTFDELLASEDDDKIRRDLFINTLFFVLGFGIIFTAAGGAAGFLGTFIKKWQLTLNIAGGLFIILFGLRLIGLIKFDFLGRLKVLARLRPRQKGLGYFGTFLIGLIFAVACSHCIGPLLYSLLIYAGLKGSVYYGMSSLALFSLGLAVPYLMTAAAIGGVLKGLRKIQDRLSIVTSVAGVFLILFGLLVMTNNFTLMSNWLSRILPYKFPGGM